ncbi:MAG: polysaccharide biosynthesis tyrosine autokinase [Deltaproteobacteria bacterium]|nr:polysaccharide biosynthesis tyrosine autokinase [Deltaproteobacteria bacterium]
MLRSLWKQRYLIILVAAVTTVLVTLWTLKQPKIYAAATTIEFDPNPPRPMGRSMDDVNSGMEGYWSTREYYSTQFQVLQSQRVSEAVVRQLGLQHDADFLGVAPEQRGSFRSRLVTDTAAVLRGRMKVEPVKDSRLVLITLEDRSPRRAQLLANTLAAVYIRQNLDQRMSTTVSALEWLGQQLESLRRQLGNSERALHDYRREHNLLSTSFEERRDHVGNRISRLSEAVTETQTRRIAIASRVSELRRAANAQDPMTMNAPELLASAPLQALRGSLEQLRRERDGLVPRYGDNAQPMLALNGRITEIETAIRREVRNVLESAESELRAVRRTEGDLRGTLGDAQREGLEINLREIEYGQLLRERENTSKLYGIVLERTKETDLSKLMRVNNVRVLDEALLPAIAVRPKVPMNIGLGLLGGILLGLLLANVVIQSDRTMRNEEDVTDDLKSTFLGLIPRIGSQRAGSYRYKYRYGGKRDDEDDKPVTNPDLVVHTHPGSAVAEACRGIRTNLLFMSPDLPFKTIMVASSDPREGKTTVAISLAITLAQSGKRVIIVDTDLRRPRVHKVFKVRPAVGITSVLVNEATLEEAVLDTEIENLQLLPCGPIPPNPSELLHSQRFQDLLTQLKGKYDRIVFDTPPVGAVTDALVIGPQLDGTILVTRARKTVRARARSVLNQLRSLNTRIAGVILNDVDLVNEGSYSYYAYAGRYEYKPIAEPANE